MKLFLLMTLLTGAAWANDEKAPSVRDAYIPLESRSASVSGNLDGSTIYDRVFGTGNNGGSCDYAS